MPDGQTVLAARAAGQIYAFRLSGGGKALSAHAGRNECPLPSPDGTKMAWLATDPQPSGYAIRKLWVMNADGSRVKILERRAGSRRQLPAMEFRLPAPSTSWPTTAA